MRIGTHAVPIRKEHTRLLEDTVEATPDVIGVAGTDGYLQYHNPKGRAALEPNLRTGQISDFHPERAARKVIKEGLPYAREHGSWQGETAFLDTEGREWPFSQIIVAHCDDSDPLTHYSSIARDLGPIYDAQAAQEAED